ncbi:MAG: Fe-S protein assembly chaperone HscA [Pseudomonadales bacterium]|nr:Fe-S protein assembly chaperone HscA [Pseudomonadales bacterium]
MALLQIAEPGRSTAPHSQRWVIGIDLGTTNSLVATVRNGAGELLSDEAGRVLLPSVVHYRSDGSSVVGHAAQAHQRSDPCNTLVSIKRFMGRELDDLSMAARRHYRFVDRPGMVRIETAAGVKTPLEVSADLLQALRLRAEQRLGGELFGAVITVPAYFDEAQRQATKDAARLAGIDVLRLLNEPTAAAVAYGLDQSVEGLYAIYDLGGGTFDFSLLRLHRGLFEVLATSGDSALGGDDFDLCIYQWMLSQVNLARLDAGDSALLLAKAREAKEALSSAAGVVIDATLADGTLLGFMLERATFDELCAGLVERTLLPVRRALRDAGVGTHEIQGVVLVGGATRMPAIRQAVARLFGQQPLTRLDPDTVVALGAAIQADALAGNRTDGWLLLDVTPLSLGIETMGGLVEKIIPRNSTLPTARAQEFTTFKDGQSAITLHVLQGEREQVELCRSLARCELRGIPPMAAGAARIRVTFQIDADGLLTVSACEQQSGVTTEVLVKPAYGLDEQEVVRMLRDSREHAREDAAVRMLREQKLEGERLLEAARSALGSDRALLSPDEQRLIEQQMQRLEAALATAERAGITQCIELLQRETDEFAARRMNAAVQQALAGRHAAELAAEL